jgi:hypothetical protein
MRWYYKTESNEEFLSSELSLRSKAHALASRHSGENSYSKYAGNQIMAFSVYGKENVILTAQNAELSYNGEYCCTVTLKVNNKKQAEDICTILFVYGIYYFL